MLALRTFVVFQKGVPGYPELEGQCGSVKAVLSGSGGTRYHIRVESSSIHYREVVVVNADVVRKATASEKPATRKITKGRPAGPSPGQKRLRDSTASPAVASTVPGGSAATQSLLSRRHKATEAWEGKGETRAADMEGEKESRADAPKEASVLEVALLQAGREAAVDAAAKRVPPEAKPASFPPEQPAVHRVWEVGGWVGTKEAKSQYWLGTAELRRLDVRSVGGGLDMGRPENFYNPKDLERMAILTHGADSYAAKSAKRAKRTAAAAAPRSPAPPPPAAAIAAAAPHPFRPVPYSAEWLKAKRARDWDAMRTASQSARDWVYSARMPANWEEPSSANGNIFVT